jgi:hypothetical protein
MPYSPLHTRLWPAAADVLCDELTKIRTALLTAKTLLAVPTDAIAKENLVQLLGELEIA